MSDLQLHFEVFAGSNVADVAVELSRISKLLQVVTMAKFNGVELMCSPTDSADILTENYRKELKSDDPLYPLASGH